ncbi:Ribose transport system permease protein RbsC [Roseimaritima multifibrata]|uniref:Ribose transport system permease protein RbsC n=1 Tax=Roseimaritima multifibrata TaxID=1930274 RepID=A0A517MK50_9BACT|nr:ABC transporter permease [Roseimaritima multifibrata]QDS95244.1 Ribose transport system permease protein RbsC [Roseimaritima multifibrata]
MRTKNLGIFLLLMAIVVLTTCLNGVFADPSNIRALIRDTSLYGLISIGVAFVIITGGIDLSIGSLIALSGVVFITVADIQKYEVDHQDPIVQVAVLETLTRDQVPDSIDPNLQQAGKKDLAVQLKGRLPDVQPGDQFRSAGKVWGVVGVQTIAREKWLLLKANNDKPQVGELGELYRVGKPLRHVITAHRSPWLCTAVVLGFCALIGLLHGLLVAWGRLQPFVVTLCGLLIYRGMARILSDDTAKGFGDAMIGFRQLVGGAAFEFPLPFAGRISGVSENWLTWIEFPLTGVLLAGVTLAAWVFLYKTVYGRHLLALGQSEQAALYSGIATRRLTVLAYVVCSTLAGLAGVLFLVDWTTMAPSTAGNFYELYAIAAAVLGGCSLRGGQGALLGVIAGAAVMRCLYKSIDLLGIGKEWEFVVIGGALFAGVVFDEVMRRITLRKQLAAKANAVDSAATS